MGKNIDKSFIQSKMLNESKGPAVHSLRAQADKQDYSRQMRRTWRIRSILPYDRPRCRSLLLKKGKSGASRHFQEHCIRGNASYSAQVLI